MPENVETDSPDAATRYRRNRDLHLAGVALAVANLVVCCLAISAGPFRGSGLPLLSNGSNYGWFMAIMFCLALLHLPPALISAAACSGFPSLRGRGGLVTLGLALAPWAEWAALFALLSQSVRS